MLFDVAARVLANTKLSPDYNVIALEAPEIARSVLPGQFVMVKPQPGIDPMLRRPFSIFEVLRDASGTVTGISLLNKRRGIDRHHSTVPLLAQLSLALSGLLSPIVPEWVLWTTALADISLWTLPYGLFYALRHRNDPEPNA